MVARVALLAFLLLPLAGCASGSVPDAVLVSSDSCFSGTLADASGSHSVDGCLSGRWSVAGNTVGATFQKKSASGSLCVRLLAKEVTVKEQCTSAAFGLVTVTA